MVTYVLSGQYVLPGSGHLPNLPISYYPLHIVPTQAVMQPPRPFAQKTGYGTDVSVALFTSNCANAGAKMRYKYIEELMQLIPTHSYGACLKNREEPTMADDPRWPAIAQRRARKIKILSNYKFYLAFENAPVLDYVSEKVFEGLIAGSLSVYRGSPSIQRFMPSNSSMPSFVDANDLSPQQLADLLLRLSKDEKEYSTYFAFKQQPLSAQFTHMAMQSYVHPNVLCRMCQYALQ
ncbi:hypothetical protein B484DRAFT_427673 [Ochromonadaceae sp. CCMP2298]|nr:hypothetical protein B484DRAFT_427673 [Ochromonadaceae sp. CCMP2298]